ncbi:MAG: M2 family metallopeptidase [Acidimicrobiia bacterium]
MTDAATVVATLSAELAPLDRAANEAWWAASTAVSDEHEAERIAADLALRNALADPGSFAALEAAAPSPDTVVERQVEVLRNAMRSQQVPSELRERIVRLEASIDATFNAHRPVVDGQPMSDNALADVLRTEVDVHRRRTVWTATKTVGAEVADRVRELAHLRNDAARALGFRDHFAMSLATAELDEAMVLDTLAAVDTATGAAFRAWKERDDPLRAERFGCTPAELRPWHYDDPFFQAVPAVPGLDLDAWFVGVDQVALTRATYAGIGLDIDAIVARSDLEPRAAKSQHAFCIDVDRGTDVRVLCNNVPGHYWTETMLHEFGHAVYDLHVDDRLPWPVRTMHPLTTEGIAMLFGRLTTDGGWLRDVAGVDEEVLAEVAPALAQRRLLTMLVFARWVLVMTNFERDFYADPDADHDTRWWELVERFQLLHRPDDRHAPDWAAKIHVALAPVYYQNYLLGELVASQLQATLVRRFGSVTGDARIGGFLRREVFAPGWSCRWDELIERATGEPLGVAAYAAELAELSAVAGG